MGFPLAQKTTTGAIILFVSPPHHMVQSLSIFMPFSYRYAHIILPAQVLPSHLLYTFFIAKQTCVSVPHYTKVHQTDSTAKKHVRQAFYDYDVNLTQSWKQSTLDYSSCYCITYTSIWSPTGKSSTGKSSSRLLKKCA